MKIKIDTKDDHETVIEQILEIDLEIGDTDFTIELLKKLINDLKPDLSEEDIAEALDPVIDLRTINFDSIRKQVNDVFDRYPNKRDNNKI